MSAVLNAISNEVEDLVLALDAEGCTAAVDIQLPDHDLRWDRERGSSNWTLMHREYGPVRHCGIATKIAVIQNAATVVRTVREANEVRLSLAFSILNNYRSNVKPALFPKPTEEPPPIEETTR